ncbi:MAG: glycosyltransferase [Planctomycetota bacterium]
MSPPATTISLPSRFAAEVLERNLAGLDRGDPSLAARLRLPVDASRVSFDADGRAFYRLHEARLPLDIEPRALEEDLAHLAGASAVTVLGLGLGEGLDAALASPAARIEAWDRDPWLVRLCLMRRDYRRELAAGRLRLRLGSDLLALEGAAGARLVHPLLGRIYARELAFLARPAATEAVALGAGELFVDQLGRAFARRGLAPWTLDIERLAREELDLTMRRLRPRLVVAVNYTAGLAEFCRAHGVPLLCWEVDPSLSPPRPPASAADHVFVFTHRRANVAAYARAGFPHVEYLPLAADPEIRAESGTRQEERPHPLTFVGASLVENAGALQGKFVAEWERWRGGAPGAAAEALAALRDILAAQRLRPEEFVLPALLEARAAGFRAFAGEAPGGVDPVLLAAEVAAAEKRLAYLANLGALGVRVWGDPGWELVTRHGVRYMGRAGHEQELTAVYGASRVNLDVGRLYQNDIVTMRVFDVLSCGAFLLAEHSTALEEVFAVGAEVASYRTVAELRAKARYYLDHPREAAEIARRGRDAVHARHTIAQRLDHMLAAMGA